VSANVTIRDTAISLVKIVETNRFGDHRGFFPETYSRAAFLAEGANLDFVQDSHLLSEHGGTAFGLSASILNRT
jgi:dTDP-4-dehydrorhamnose 3,5-epimerase